MKATWAVACLLSAALLVTGGCATKKVAEATPAGAVETIKEENVAVAVPAPDNAAKAPVTAAADNVSKLSAEAQPAAYTGPAYKLGPEDQIRVSVWENKELTLDLVVRPDGKISMPLIQDVEAEGLTAVELGNRIQQKLLAFLKDPQVSVIVLQVNAPRYYVLGSVAKPGPYLLRTETSVLQALAMAGGFTQFASPRSIKLIRNAGGKQEVRKINYYNLLDEDGEGNHILRSGDTIVVP